MKLTNEHLGKRMRIAGQHWFPGKKSCIIINIDNPCAVQYIRIDAEGKAEEGGEIIQSGFSVNDAWELYDDCKDFFDFSKFGCNEQPVRDLIEALDKRYGVKDDKGRKL